MQHVWCPGACPKVPNRTNGDAMWVGLAVYTVYSVHSECTVCRPCIRLHLALRVAPFLCVAGNAIQPAHPQAHGQCIKGFSSSQIDEVSRDPAHAELGRGDQGTVPDRDGDGVPDRINHDARGLVQPLPVPGHHDGTHRRHRRHEDDRRCDCPGVTVTTCDVDDASNTCTHLAPCAPFWNKIYK